MINRRTLQIQAKLTYLLLQEVNFFGLMDVTRKAMETMRDLKTGGLIQQVTSIGGQRGVPTFSIYCASKWAVEVCPSYTRNHNMKLKKTLG